MSNDDKAVTDAADAIERAIASAYWNSPHPNAIERLAAALAQGHHPGLIQRLAKALHSDEVRAHVPLAKLREERHYGGEGPT